MQDIPILWHHTVEDVKFFYIRILESSSNLTCEVPTQ